MANDYTPRPDAQFHARRNHFVTYVNGHLGDLGPAAGLGGDMTLQVVTRHGGLRDRQTASAATQRHPQPADEAWHRR